MLYSIPRPQLRRRGCEAKEAVEAGPSTLLLPCLAGKRTSAGSDSGIYSASAATSVYSGYSGNTATYHNYHRDKVTTLVWRLRVGS